MMLVIAVVLFLVVLALLSLFLLADNNRQHLEQRFKTAGIFSSHADYTNEEFAKPLHQRLFQPFFDSFGNLFKLLTPQALQLLLEDKLREAGQAQTVTVKAFLLRWGLVLLVLTIGCLYISRIEWQLSLAETLGNLAVALLIGVLLPCTALRRQIATRKEGIERQLSDVMDLLLVSVQAGTSFDGAVSRVVKQMQGPLVVELQTLLQEMRLGMSRQEALRALGERCRVLDVSLLVSTLIQADRLGVSISQFLEVQAQLLRKKRLLRAREAAMKAPVKLVFPLVFFFLPVIFMALLAPIALKLKGVF